MSKAPKCHELVNHMGEMTLVERSDPLIPFKGSNLLNTEYFSPCSSSIPSPASRSFVSSLWQRPYYVQSKNQICFYETGLVSMEIVYRPLCTTHQTEPQSLKLPR